MQIKPLYRKLFRQNFCQNKKSNRRFDYGYYQHLSALLVGKDAHPTTVSSAVGWLSKPPKQLKPAVMARLKRSLNRGNLLFHQSCHCETDAVSRGNLLVV